MQESARRPLWGMTTTQLAVAGLAALLLIFVVVGSISERMGPEPVFAVGIQTQPFIVLAFLSVVAGVLSFASPCTLPILPAYFAFAFQSGRKQIALNTIVFMLGLATVFSLMGAGASALGRVLRQNQQLILLLGGALVLVFGVMSLLGLGFTGMKQAEGGGANNSIGSSFVFGMTFAVGWTSCTGPILGTVLTMAAATGSVTRGMFLLFIYALGLGLPLIIVSTFFGRASRQSLMWRLLRGKGWQVVVHALVVGLVWALAIWRILVAVAEYLTFRSGTFTGDSLAPGLEYGLLAVALAFVALWIFTGPAEKRRVRLNLHSTQLFSGVLFAALGLLMLNGALADFNSIVPPELALWFAGAEEKLIALFS